MLLFSSHLCTQGRLNAIFKIKLIVCSVEIACIYVYKIIMGTLYVKFNYICVIGYGTVSLDISTVYI